MPPARFLWFLKIPIQKSIFLFVFLTPGWSKTRLFLTKVYFLAFIREQRKWCHPRVFLPTRFYSDFTTLSQNNIRFLITFLFILFIKISSAALRWPLNVRTSASSLSLYILFMHYLVEKISRFADQNFIRKYSVFFWNSESIFGEVFGKKRTHDITTDRRESEISVAIRSLMTSLVSFWPKISPKKMKSFQKNTKYIWAKIWSAKLDFILSAGDGY